MLEIEQECNCFFTLAQRCRCNGSGWRRGVHSWLVRSGSSHGGAVQWKYVGCFFFPPFPVFKITFFFFLPLKGSSANNRLWGLPPGRCPSTCCGNPSRDPRCCHLHSSGTAGRKYSQLPCKHCRWLVAWLINFTLCHYFSSRLPLVKAAETPLSKYLILHLRGTSYSRIPPSVSRKCQVGPIIKASWDQITWMPWPRWGSGRTPLQVSLRVWGVHACTRVGGTVLHTPASRQTRNVKIKYFSPKATLSVFVNSNGKKRSVLVQLVFLTCTSFIKKFYKSW